MYFEIVMGWTYYIWNNENVYIIRDALFYDE